jgi:hypothetical protein
VKLLNIPKQQVAGLKAIAGLSPPETEAILRALSRHETPTYDDFVSAISEELKKSREQTDEIARIVMSLSTLRADVGDLLPEFIADLSKSMAGSGYADLHLDPASQEKFRANITRLLGHEPLNIAAKILYLRSNYEHVFCRARVITDARPIYREDRAAAPAAAIITHILALHYHEGDQLKEIHVAMDDEDVAKLKSLLERAQTKQKSLATALRDAKLAVITKSKEE